MQQPREEKVHGSGCGHLDRCCRLVTAENSVTREPTSQDLVLYLRELDSAHSMALGVLRAGGWVSRRDKEEGKRTRVIDNS